MEIADKFGRFKDAPWFNDSGIEENVIIGGAGGIGSWLALFLNRAGFIPFVFDFDHYEAHNMGGQLCKTSDIGKAKVVALQDTIKQLCGNEVYAHNEKYISTTFSHKFVFSGFDNMEARRVMFNNWLRIYAEDKDAIFIDGRLSMEQLQIYCITPDKAERYKETLFADSEVEEAPCTMKQTTHTAAMIASHMTAFFTNHVTNIKAGNKDRAVPFYWELLSPIDFLTVED